MAYITNGHDINLKTFYSKVYLIGYVILLVFSLIMLVVPTTYFLGFFMFLVLIFGGLGTTYYRLNKMLIKVYHLTKVNNNVYEWVERWEDRKFVEENMDPAFFYRLGKDLVPIIDYTTDTPKPFKPFDLGVVDCSFISLRQILPAVVSLLPTEGQVVALIKPQFEAGKAEVDKGQGVIRDPKIHKRVLDELKLFINNESPLKWLAETESPLLGPAGNKEFLVQLKK